MIEKNNTKCKCTPKELARSALGNNTKCSAKSPSNKSFLFDILSTAQRFMPDSRVATCHKVPTFGNSDLNTSSVAVGRSESGKHIFGGVSKCGNLWQCPVCANRVTKARADEICHAMMKNAQLGGQSVFVTLTFPHTRFDSIKENLDKLSKALTKMKAHRSYRELLERYGFIGEIRALELTHSFVNGWHPHIHAIFLFDNISINKDICLFQSELYDLWLKFTTKVGFPPISREHGVDVRLPRGTKQDLANYISKWGLELTSSHTKKGRKALSRTPFQIMHDLDRRYLVDDHNLLKEYAEATHGKRRIFWSQRLKARFDIEEFNDEQLANFEPTKPDFYISWETFKVLRFHKVLGRVLDISDEYGTGFAKSFIDNLMLDEFDKQAEYRRQRYDLKRRIEASTYQIIHDMGVSSLMHHV